MSPAPTSERRAAFEWAHLPRSERHVMVGSAALRRWPAQREQRCNLGHEAWPQNEMQAARAVHAWSAAHRHGGAGQRCSGSASSSAI